MGDGSGSIPAGPVTPGSMGYTEDISLPPEVKKSPPKKEEPLPPPTPPPSPDELRTLAASGKINLDVLGLDAKGNLKAQNSDPAKKATLEVLKKFLESEALKKMKPGSDDYQKAVLKFLESNTKFPLLHSKDQKTLLLGEPLQWKPHDIAVIEKSLQSNWTPNRKIAHALRLEGEGRYKSAQALYKNLKSAQDAKKPESEIKALESELRQSLGDASQLFHRASELDPKNIVLHCKAAKTRLLWSLKEPDSKVAEQLGKESQAHLKAVTDLMRGEVLKARAFLEVGKLEEAQKVLGRIESEFGKDLAETQGSILRKSDDYVRLSAQSALYRGEIADRQNNHSEAVPQYESALEGLNLLLKKDPKNKEASELRARVNYDLQNYEACLEDAGAVSSNAQEVYRQKLNALGSRFSLERQKATMSSNVPLEMLYLTEEIKIAKALKDEAKATTLSKDLESKTKAMAVGRVLSDSQKMVDEGKLTQPLLDAEFKKYVPESLGKAQDYIAITEKDGKKTVALKPAFEKLSDKDKVAVLQGLQVVGMIGHHRKALAEEKDPTKKIYHEAKLALFEGNLPLAKLKMMDFKAAAEKVGGAEKLDGEGKEMLSEMRKGLKAFTLGAIQKLEQASEQIIVQELAKIESKGLTDKNQYKAFFGTLRQIVESGKADTLDEAVAYMKSENQRIQNEFEKFPVIKKGMVAHTPNDRKKFGFVGDAEWSKRRDELSRFSQLLNQKPTDPALFDPKSFPDLLSVRLEGGTLDMMSAWGAPSPPPTRVIIGKEGGTIFGADGRKYTFPPSDKERVIAFSGTTGSLIKHNVYPDHSLQEGRDYQAETTTGNSGAFYGHQLISHWMVTGPQAGSYEHHIGKFGDWTNVGIRAAPLKVIFDLETREGLEKMKDPQGRREYLLGTAETLRARHGSYAAASEILEGLFATDFRKARAEVEVNQKDEISKIKTEAEGDRGDIQKKVEKQVEELKSKSPEVFKKIYPAGGTDKEIQAKVDEVLQSKIEFGINKLAFKKIDGWADQGKLSDPTAAKAWKIYEDMKDPTDKWHNLADETWDGIVNEVIMTVVTMPIAMGAGSLVRAGLAGTEVVGSLLLRRGAIGLATRLGIVLAGEAAFSLTQNLLNSALFGEEITLRSIGVGMAMGLAFRGGGKLWAEAAGGLGVGEKALAKAAQSGSKAQLALMKMANTSGQLSTQTMVAFTFGEVEAAFFPHGDRPDQTVWERLGGHALRMVAFHYGMHALNVMTGGAAHRSDMLVESRFKLGKEGYKVLYEKNYKDLLNKGVPEKEASQQAGKLSSAQAYDFAKGFDFDPSSKEKVPGLLHKQEGLIRDTFGFDPKSPEGQHLILLLSAYARSHGEGGKPLSDAELFRAAEELNGSLKVFLKRCGVTENSDLSQGLKNRLVMMALENGISPEKFSEYGEHFSDLKDRLHLIANSVFGKNGSKTPEGQQLIASLVVRAILKSKSASEVVGQFEGLSDQVIKVGEALRASTDRILGGKGSETAEGRELMNLLLLRSIDQSENSKELLDRLNEINAMADDVGVALNITAAFVFGEKASASPEARRFMNELFLEALKSSPDASRVNSVFERLSSALYDLSSPTPNLFDLCGFEKPAERWALIRWALRTDQTPASVKVLTEQILKGKMELVVEKGAVSLREVPDERQVVQKKAVEARVPIVELGPDEFHSFEEMKASFTSLYVGPDGKLLPQAGENLEVMKKKLAEIEQAFGEEPNYKKEIDWMKRTVRWLEGLPDMTAHLEAEEGTKPTQAEPTPLHRPKPKQVKADQAPSVSKAAFDMGSTGRPPPSSPQKYSYRGTQVSPDTAVLDAGEQHLPLSFGSDYLHSQTMRVGFNQTIDLRFYGDVKAKNREGHFTLLVHGAKEGTVKIRRADGRLDEVSTGKGSKPIELFDGDVIEVGKKRLTFRSPSEIKTRNELAKEGREIELERQSLGSTPDPQKEGALKIRETVFRDKLAQMGRTVDGTPFVEKMPEVAREISRSIFDGYFAGPDKKRIELFDSKGRIAPQGRVALREKVVADLAAIGMKVSTENSKAVDSIIDLALTARAHGIIDKPDGITRAQFNQLIGELYFSNNPSIRIGFTELTHVPMVVEGTLNHFETAMRLRGKTVGVAEKKTMFLAALLHDAGKWDPNIRTETGYTVLAKSPFNKTGKDIVVKPGQSLNEALKDQGIDPSQVALPFPGMAAILVHHDASTVRATMTRLVEMGLLSKAEGDQVWTAIQYHGFVSSWIVLNSLGRIGIKSHVFNADVHPELQPFLEAYQRISNRLNEKGILNNLDELLKDPLFAKDAKVMRETFEKMSPYIQALMLGDHQGQIDIVKYMSILGGKRELNASPDTTVFDLLFGNEERIPHPMENSVLGVLRSCSFEQLLFSKNQGLSGRSAFEAAENWLQGEGLAKALQTIPEFQEWVKDHPTPRTLDAVHSWLRTVKIKADGKPTPEFQKIQAAVEKAFYEFYAIGETRTQFDWSTPVVKPRDLSPMERSQAERLKHEKLGQEIDQAFEEVGQKTPTQVREALIEAYRNGKIGTRELQEILGHRLPKELIPFVEERLGIKRDQWLTEFIKDPQAFAKTFHDHFIGVMNTHSIISRWVGLVQRGKVEDKQSPAAYEKDTPDAEKKYATEFEHICGAIAQSVSNMKIALAASEGPASEEGNLPAVKSMIRLMEEAKEKGLIDSPESQARIGLILTQAYLKCSTVESAEALARQGIGLVSVRVDEGVNTVRYDLSAKTVIVPNIAVYEEAAKFATSDSPMAETARLFLEGKVSYDQYQKAKSGGAEVVDLASRRKSAKPPASPVEEGSRKAAEDDKGKARPPEKKLLGAVEPVLVDGLPHQPVILKAGVIAEAPPPPSGKVGLDAWVGQMKVGQVYRFEAMNEAGTGKETNYVFRDSAGNIYLVPQWLAAKLADHGPRGSKFVVPPETVLQAMADSVAEGPVSGTGRYEMHVTAEGGVPVGLDTVAPESTIQSRGLKGQKVTIEREFDSVETFVVPDSEINSPQSYGSSQFHAVFLDGNPQYAKEVAEALGGFGVTPESWSAENKGRIRIPITAFPGKYMPPRHMAETWKGVRTLMTETDYQSWKTSRESLEKAGVLKPAFAVREKVMAQDVASLEAMLTTGGLKDLPEGHKTKIREEVELLKKELAQTSPNPRNIQNAKLELVSTVEAALLLKAGLDPNQVKAGLLVPGGTPKKVEVLKAVEPSGPKPGGPHLPPSLGATLAIGIGLLTLLSPDLAHAASSHGPHGVDVLLHGGLFTAGLIGVAGIFSRFWGRMTGGSSPEVGAPADKGGGASFLLSPPPPPTFIPPSVTLEMFTSRDGTKSYKLQPYTNQAQTMIGFHVTARSQGIQIISEAGKVTVHFRNKEGRVFRAEMSLDQAQGLGLVEKTELGYRPSSKELTFNLKELASTLKSVPPNFDLEEATQVLPVVGKQVKGPEAIPAPPLETGEIPTSRRSLTDNWERPILFGDVDLDNPPFMKSKATEERGSTAGVSTQGRGADLKGLKMNEDVIMRVVTPKGEEYLLDLDGMGGEGNGYLAARLGAQAFMAEIRRSGDPDKAWQMANAVIRRFNGKLREQVGVPVEDPEDGLSHQQRYLIKMASPEQVAEAEKAAQAFILNPEQEMNGPMASGAGAVAVGLRLIPPRTPGAPHIIQFTWVGDARGMLLERGIDGKWQRVYQTVDEGFNRHMKPGKDFDWGGGRRTLFAQIHPRANMVFNGLGGKDQVKLQKTANGEVPDPNPNSPSGFKVAPHLENGIAIKEGQLAILGSDGFWEQFGSTNVILSLIEGCKTSEEAVKVLTDEAHFRMGVLEKVHKGELQEVLPNRYRFDRPEGILFMAKTGEKKVMDEKGKWVTVPILELRRANTLYIDESGKVYEKSGDQDSVDHYKIDNFSLIAYHHQLKPAVPATTTLRRSPPPPPSLRGLPAEPIQKAADDSRSVSRPPTLTPPKGIPAATIPLLGKMETHQFHNKDVLLSLIPLQKGEVEIYVGDPKKREGDAPPSHPVITVYDDLIETGKPELFAVMDKTEDGHWRVVPRMDFRIVGKNGKVRQEAGDHKPLVLEDQDRFTIGIADFVFDAKKGMLIPKVTGDVEIQLDIPQ